MRRVIVLAAGLAFGSAGARAQDCGRASPWGFNDCNRNAVPDDCDVTPGSFGLARAGFSEVGSATGIAAADLDGDGSRDLAAALDRSREVVVLLNGGQGTFPSARYTPLEEGPVALAAADLDGDGDADLAAAHGQGVSVLANDGRGGLERRADILIQQGPRDIRAADIDGDGDIDLVTLNDLPGAPSGNISAILNEGAAGFAPPRHQAAGRQPVGLALADLDGDRDLDAAIVGLDDGVRVLTNAGGGRFTVAPVLPFEGRLFSLAAGDLDGDGDVDLAGFSLDETLNTFLNDGRGGFAFAAGMDAGNGFPAARLVAGDLDGDGSLDLAMPGQRAVLLNDGAARFHAHRLRDALVWPLPAVIAELDGDGALDVAAVDERGVAGIDERGIAILLNRPAAWSDDCDRNGVPDECQADCDCNGIPDSCDLAAGRASDCDGDGVSDACEPDCDSNGLPDDCDIAEGRTSDANRNGLPDACEAPLADCDGNGIPDDADVELGAPDCNGNGAPDACDVAETFHFLGIQHVALPGARSGLADDVDGDGLLDLIVSGSTGTWVFHGVPEGRLGRPRAIGPGSVSLAAADLDGDGDLDAAVSIADRDVCGEGEPRLPVRLRALIQEDGGSFRPADVRAMEHGIASLEAGDFTGDGLTDIAVSTHRGLRLLEAPGGAAFRESAVFGDSAGHLTAADLDGDRDLDLAVSGEGLGAVLFNDGSGEFSKGGRFLSGAGRTAAADLDGDGDVDLVGHDAIVNLNDGRGAFPDGSFLGAAGRVALGDATGDGLPDLFLAGGEGVSLHINDGEGQFASLEPFRIDDQVAADLVAGDFDRDGLADIAAVDGSGLTLLLNLGAPGSFGRRVIRDDALEDFHKVGALDADGDGDQDIVIASLRELRLHANPGNGRLDAPVAVDEAETVAPLAVADLDGDAADDIALGSWSWPRVLVHWNDPEGFPGTADRVPVLGIVSSLATLDLEGDGDLDIATASTATRAISLAGNEGGRRFSEAVPVLLDAPAAWILAADMDGDGSPDLITGHDDISTSLPAVSFLRNDGRGRFPEGHIIRLSGEPLAGATADADSDGDTDIVLSLAESRPFCCREGKVVILLNLGGGKLLENVVHESPFVHRSLLASDFDRDGDMDIAFPLSAEEGSDTVSYGRAITVILNEGGGAFGPPREISVGRAPGSMVAADLDGDGLPDITTVSERRLSTVFPRLAAASADDDRDGVPDGCGAAPFRRGDADADGAVGLADPVTVLLHLFRGGAAPPCPKAADADDDGRVGLGDAVHVLRFLFLGGPAPAFPGEACGLDPTADSLPCDAHAPCA